MKKILALLLMVSVVAVITLPAMATDGASKGVSAISSSNGGNANQNFDVDVSGSNTAAHTVNVALTVEPQTNWIGKNIAASGNVDNAALADFDATATADDATSGQANGNANAGAAISGSAENENKDVKKASVDADAETGKAVSAADTDANTGDAVSAAKVNDNTNTAKANDNTLKSGNVNNDIYQTNIVKQITPIDINADQKLVQKVKVFGIQDASSYPVTVAKQKNGPHTDIDLNDVQFEIGSD